MSKVDYENMSVFEQVRQGLTEAIAHTCGELTLRTTTLPAAESAAKKWRSRGSRAASRGRTRD